MNVHMSNWKDCMTIIYQVTYLSNKLPISLIVNKKAHNPPCQQNKKHYFNNMSNIYCHTKTLY